MSKKDQYKLNFSKVKIDNRIHYGCSRWGDLPESPYLSELLDHLANIEAEGLLEEINNAIANKDFEEYYSLDVSPISLRISPPNIFINEIVEFPLSELKILLEEWIAFCKSSFY
jgi:hypothetical protein